MKLDNLNDISDHILKLEKEYLSLEAVIKERKSRKLALEKECREAGFDPDKLKDVVLELEAEKVKISDSLQKLLEELEEELKAYDNK